MVRNIFTLIVVACLLFTTVGYAARSIKLTAMEDGKTINIKTGALIVVELDGNPITGYSWEAKDLDTAMLQQVGEAVFISGNPGLMGAGGKLTLTFKSLASGKTNLELVYHRPWEKNVEPLRTYSVTVNVA